MKMNVFEIHSICFIFKFLLFWFRFLISVLISKITIFVFLISNKYEPKWNLLDLSLRVRKNGIGEIEKRKGRAMASSMFKNLFWKKVAVEWFEGITSSKLNLAFVSNGFADQSEFLETVKGIMESKLKGVAEWPDIVAIDGYNGSITNMAENFTSQTD